MAQRFLNPCTTCPSFSTWTWSSDKLCHRHRPQTAYAFDLYPTIDVAKATQAAQELIDVFGELPKGSASCTEVTESAVTIVASIIEEAVVREAQTRLAKLDASGVSEEERNSYAAQAPYEIAAQLFPIPHVESEAIKSFEGDPTSLAYMNASINFVFSKLWDVLRFGGALDPALGLAVQCDLEAYLEVVGNSIVIPETRRVFGEMLYMNTLVVESVTGAPARNQNRFNEALMSVPAAYAEAEAAFQAEQEARRLTVLAQQRAEQESAAAEQEAQQAAYRAAVWAQQEAEKRAELAKQRVKTGLGIAGRLLKSAWDFEAELKRDRDRDRREREEAAHRRTVQENSKIINDRLRRQRGY